MRISHKSKLQLGISLIEMVAFLVVVGIAASAIFGAYNYTTTHNVDAIVHMRLLESAQSKLDEILALKYDANTPTGGIPACNSASGLLCDNTPDANMNDVDDFNGYSDSPYPHFTRTVSVTTDNTNNIKIISVTVATTAPSALSITLAAYKANF
jgi:MSHA pilin protein MshD